VALFILLVATLQEKNRIEKAYMQSYSDDTKFIKQLYSPNSTTFESRVKCYNLLNPPHLPSPDDHLFLNAQRYCAYWLDNRKKDD